MNDKVILNDFDDCLTHKGKCRRVPDSKSCKPLELLLQLAGSSCKDWSPFGKRGCEAGPSAPAFMVLNLADKCRASQSMSQNLFLLTSKSWTVIKFLSLTAVKDEDGEEIPATCFRPRKCLWLSATGIGTRTRPDHWRIVICGSILVMFFFWLRYFVKLLPLQGKTILCIPLRCRLKCSIIQCRAKDFTVCASARTLCFLAALLSNQVLAARYRDVSRKAGGTLF